LAIVTLSAMQSFAQDSVDYKWTVQGDSNISFVSAEDYGGGEASVMALYSLTEKLQAGGKIGLGFGDLEYDAAISIAARYFLNDSWFAYGEYGLTETSIDQAALGAGYRVKIGDRIEFNPTAIYLLDSEMFTLSMGFAIRF
jgi:hypothetical protein